MTEIGPNFYNEIAAAGLAGLPFSWGTDGDLNYGEAITDEQRAAIEGVLASHSAARPNPTIAAPALLAGGIALTSTGTPALDGTYACDDASRARIVGEQLCIQVAGKFTNGSEQRVWHDIAGTPHQFNTEQFTAFAEAVGQFADAVVTAQMSSMPSGVSWSPPSNAYMIP